MQGDPHEFLNQAGPGFYSLDDLDAIAGDTDWEETLHHFYNAVRDQNGRLISASRLPPSELPIRLADLQSRLNWGPAFQIQELPDEGKRQVMIQTAEARGLQLSAESASYLLNHQERDLGSLLAMLELLDRASLSEQRRLSIPFIRSVLNA
jgi:DnaA family protein